MELDGISGHTKKKSYVHFIITIIFDRNWM